MLNPQSILIGLAIAFWVLALILPIGSGLWHFFLGLSLGCATGLFVYTVCDGYRQVNGRS